MSAPSRVDGIRPDGRPRVLVTGMGVVSPIGCGTDEFHAAQLAARSGVRVVTRFPTDELPVRIAAELDLPPSMELNSRERAKSDRCTQLAVAAAEQAVADSGLAADVAAGGTDPSRVAVVLGCGLGGVATVEDNMRGFLDRGPAGIRPRGVPMSMINDAGGNLAVRYGLTGPCTTVATACASAAEAISTAHQMIVAGEVDAALVGGTDAPITPGVLVGFARLGALSARNDDPAAASRPFEADRDGFVVGEGAGVLVLESAAHAARRGARPHAEMLGYGRTCDAYHVTMPQPEGRGARDALRAALRSARLDPADVSHVNTHGTSTSLNDAAEAVALRAVFGDGLDDLPLTATKSLTGHSLGAAGALEAVASVQALVSGLVPPTANHDRPDTGLGPLAIGTEVVETKVEVALSNSFGFGGHNVVLAFGRC